MKEHKFKFLRLFLVLCFTLSFLVMPTVSLAGSIADDVEDLEDDFEDYEDELSDLETLIDESYGLTVEAGDYETTHATALNSFNNLYTTTNPTWTSSKPLYAKVDGTTSDTTTVGTNDIRIFNEGDFLGGSTVQDADADVSGTTFYKVTNDTLKMTGTTSWEKGDDIYQVSVSTDSEVAINHTRITKEKIIWLTQLNGLFQDVEDYTDDVQDDLDDFKGESIPQDLMNDIEDATNDVVDAAEDVVSIIDDYKDTSLNDDFDNKEDDFKDELDDISDDLNDIATGIDNDNGDVEDFEDALSDVEDDVDDKADKIPSTVDSTSSMQGFLDDLDGYLEDAEDEIDDLDGEEFATDEQTAILNAWNDLEDAFINALDDLEDAVDNADDNNLEDDFSDERDDMEADINDEEDTLNGILTGESSEISRDADDAKDDIDDAKDNIREYNSFLINSYGDEALEEGDEDYNSTGAPTGATATTLKSTKNPPTFSDWGFVYEKGTGNTGTTVEEDDIRITPKVDYLSGSEVKSADTEIDPATDIYDYDFYKNSSNGIVYFRNISDYYRVNREDIMILSELQDMFEDIEDEIDDVGDALQDLDGGDLSATDIDRVESAYDSFVNKVENYIEDIDDYKHSTLDDYYESLEEDYDRDMDDLEDLMTDLTNGTSTTVGERVTDFEDELNDIEDNIDAIKNRITTTLTEPKFNDAFGDLDDELDDAGDEVEDLAGYEYSEAEKSRLTDSLDDISTALDDALEQIEENLPENDPNLNLDDDYDDEEDDILGEMETLENDLNAMLEGGEMTNTREINNLLDDLKDYKDDLDDVYTKINGNGVVAASLDRTDVKDFCDDMEEPLDDAEDALNDYLEIPSSLAVARIRSRLNSLEDKKDDALKALEKKVKENGGSGVDDKFKDKEDGVEDKWDEVDDAAQFIYDREVEDKNDDDDSDDSDENNDGDDNDDGTGDEPQTVNFVDVASNNVFKEDIEALASMGIINGYYDGTFRPNNPITRGEFLKVVAGASEADVTSPSGVQRFSDVPVSHPFYDWIDYASQMGHIGGYTNGTFKPSDFITRYEAVVITTRFRALSPNNTPTGSLYFIDITDATMGGYTDVAYENQILNGYSDQTFRPQNNITRGETAKIAANAFS